MKNLARQTRPYPIFGTLKEDCYLLNNVFGRVWLARKKKLGESRRLAPNDGLG
jgi:hypothetical protein